MGRSSVNPSVEGNDIITDDSRFSLSKSVLVGETDGGVYKNVPVSQEGHIEVSLHEPRLPFGSIHTESLTPVFQTDGVYGINPQQIIETTGLAVGSGSGSGSNTSSNNMLISSTGTTQYSFASMQSRRRLRYRPGQGVVGRFAGFFSTPAENSIVVAGFGTAESGFYFGYNGTSFGVLHSTGGVREIQTLTVTTASTATNDYRITLPNGDTVDITATNNSSTVQTAYEISLGTFPGWEANAVGSTVVFLAGSVGNKSGTIALSQPSAGTPAAGTVAQTVAGVAGTDTWVAQSSWNGDVLDGSSSASNPSGFNLDPSKGNVYSVGVQYLGFGTVTMMVEVVSEGSNNPTFVTAHTFKFNNTLTVPHSRQPSFPFTMSAYSAGSTTDVSVSIGSFGGFIEGKRVGIGPRQTYYDNAGVSSSTSAYTPIFTVKNSLVYQSRANQAVTNLVQVSGAAKSNTGLTTFYLIRNATLGGAPSFSSWSNTSTTLVDTAATSCTFTGNEQVVWVGTISESGDFNHVFGDREITLQPGESVTLAVRSVTATATCVGSLNTREDQ